MKTLYFVRHGETDWNAKHLIMGQRDLPLNARGREQAALTAKLLADIPFTTCYSSDLGRARETAEILLANRNLAISADPRLREIKYGVFEGLTAKEWATAFPQDYAHYQANTLRNAPTGAESRLQLMARIDDFLQDTSSNQANDETILVVTHGGTMAALFNLLLVKEQGGEPAYFHRLFRFDNCGVSVLRYEHDHWRVLIANCGSHL
ncbi:MAG: histidine phosphatase family protein [Verrucomicrobiales bacterium]|nr:histidine phosphatase family protein [Verrucomicrobiales bacterium]